MPRRVRPSPSVSVTPSSYASAASWQVVARALINMDPASRCRLHSGTTCCTATTCVLQTFWSIGCPDAGVHPRGLWQQAALLPAPRHFWHPPTPQSADRRSLLRLRARRVDFFALCEAPECFGRSGVLRARRPARRVEHQSQPRRQSKSARNLCDGRSKLLKLLALHTLSSADEKAQAGGQVEAEGSKGGCSCPQPAPAMQERQLAQPRVPCLACHLGAKPPLLRRHVRLGNVHPDGQGGLQDPRRVGRAFQISTTVIQVQLAQLRGT